MRRRVLSSRLDSWVDPQAVFVALFGSAANAFWLDSGDGATSGVSYLGCSERVVTASVADGMLTEPSSGARRAGTMLDFLREEQAAGRDAWSASASQHAGPFQLGWVGWLGYELHAQTMASGIVRGSRYPDAAMMFVDRCIAFDHATRTVSLLALGDRWAGSAQAWRERTGRAIAQAGAVAAAGQSSAMNPPPGPPPAVRWAYSDAEYLELIDRCQHAIGEGDAYQLCLTTEVRVDDRPDPLITYLDLRALSPTHHGGFLRLGSIALLSTSPEQFLTVSRDGALETKPIKGTRRRGETPQEDAALAAALIGSDKERAENLMIVDLMRNDLGRVSRVGSVTVPRLLEVESYPQVHQLVSTVRGQLAAGLTGVDAVAACFPAGSMTGAPKGAAVAILDDLEARPRGIYSGAFGYFGLDGRIELAMVIRSIVIDDDGASIGTGGGITALSVASEELEEVKIKAAALLRVLGA